MAASSYLYAARDCVAYLHHPPPASWVVRVAAAFRAAALVLILPCVLLTALDVASYLVVRTLGADSAAAAAHRRRRPAPPHAAAAAAFFATPSEANLALAGEGIFSPPQSRAASPPVSRSGTAPAGAPATPRPDGDAASAAALRNRARAGEHIRS